MRPSGDSPKPDHGTAKRTAATILVHGTSGDQVPSDLSTPSEVLRPRRIHRPPHLSRRRPHGCPRRRKRRRARRSSLMSSNITGLETAADRRRADAPHLTDSSGRSTQQCSAGGMAVGPAAGAANHLVHPRRGRTVTPASWNSRASVRWCTPNSLATTASDAPCWYRTAAWATDSSVILRTTRRRGMPARSRWWMTVVRWTSNRRASPSIDAPPR